ncbi:MAG: S8 family serine peptidase [Thermoleophilia bacterium]|nr:S8 family serine peptidase [Thermoleophilia bacterium]
MPAVKLPKAWDLTTGSSAVTLAVVDTGLGIYRPGTGLDLLPDFPRARIVSPWSAYSISDAESYWRDVVGHGTAVTGVAAALGNNQVGIAGADWQVNIMPVHVADSEEMATSVVAAGVVWAVDHGARVINASFGGGEPSQTEKAAFEYAVSRGAMVVAAAGNDGRSNFISYPAALPGVIAVGSTDSSRQVSSFSNKGYELDLVAPGENILTYGIANDADGRKYVLRTYSGTSFSTPLVAGVTSLMLARNPQLTRQQVEDILCTTADDLGPAGWDPESGYGLLDAYEAVLCAGDKRSPEVSFSAPADGAEVSGLVQLVVNARDDIRLGKLELYLDGNLELTYLSKAPRSWDESSQGGLAISDMTSPFRPRFDSTGLPDGSVHVIKAVAYDVTGNRREASVTVKVKAAAGTSAVTFRDVSTSHPYYTAIKGLVSCGIINGFSDGTFRPSNPLMRQQFAKMIVLSMQLPVSEQDRCPFRDVSLSGPSSLYPDNYIAVAAARGITTGYADGTFRPASNITRAQVITMIVRAARNLMPGSLQAPPSSYRGVVRGAPDAHAENVRWAEYNGLLNGLVGLGPTWNPNAKASRGEVAQMLWNLLKKGML